MSKIILLIHELWVTPLSWEPFRRFYGNLGYQVLAPAWPGMEGSIEQLRHIAPLLEGLEIGEVTTGYAKIVHGLAEPPVIMGHGFGGVVAQLLIDQGLGAAGVAIASLPPKGVLIRSLSTGLAMLPALANPFLYRGSVELSFGQFWRRFCNTLPEAEARRVYESQAVPAPCRPIFQVMLANLTPHAATTVDFKHPDRAPLLFIGGGGDGVVPSALVRSTFRKHRASPCVTEYREFPGRGHYLIAEQGWQEVADYALTWATAHARARE